MTITTHVCRGNFRSTWISSGGYEPVAETMLGVTNYDGYFLEYDSDRAGGFEPLRYLPKGNKVVVVGLITSKFGELEKRDEITRRLEEAAKFAPLEQLALGVLKPGDKLPPERDLAQQLGVSRNVLREALRSLEMAGVLRLQKFQATSRVHHVAVAMPTANVASATNPNAC